MTVEPQKLREPHVAELIGLPPKVIVRCWPDDASNKPVDTEYVPAELTDTEGGIEP